MTRDSAAGLKKGQLVYCQAPGRVFHQHQMLVTSVDTYEDGRVFVMAKLPNPPSEMGPDSFVFEPDEIEVLH